MYVEVERSLMQGFSVHAWAFHTQMHFLRGEYTVHEHITVAYYLGGKIIIIGGKIATKSTKERTGLGWHMPPNSLWRPEAWIFSPPGLRNESSMRI